MIRSSWWTPLTSLCLLLWVAGSAAPRGPIGSLDGADVLPCEMRDILRAVHAVTGVGTVLMSSPGTVPGSGSVYPGAILLVPLDDDCPDSFAARTGITSEPPLLVIHLSAPGRYPSFAGLGRNTAQPPHAPSSGGGAGAGSGANGLSGVAPGMGGSSLLGGFIGSGGSGGGLAGGGIAGSGIAGSGVSGGTGAGNGGTLGGGGFGGGGFGGGIAGSGGTGGTQGGSGGGSGKGPPLHNPEPSSILLLLLGSGGLLCYAGWKRWQSAS